MTSYNFRKSLQKYLFLIIEFIFIAWIVITIVFFLLNGIPGNESAINPTLSFEAQEIIKKQLGLDLNIWQRYINYLVNLITKAEFGISSYIKSGQQVGAFLFQKMLVSFKVGFSGLLLGLIIGIPLGIYVGRKPGSLIDSLATIFIAISVAIPVFVFGIFLLLFAFKIKMPFLYDELNPVTFIWPILAIGLPTIAGFVRYLRTSINQETNSQYVLFAKIKGCKTSRIIWKHTLKPALYPIATFVPIAILGSVIGSIVLENIFSIPGTGSLLLEAVAAKDYNVVLAVVIILCLINSIGFFIRDFLYTILDPRARIS